MTTYTLNVNIDPTVFPVLKQSYNLCIAKKVNGTYNVVWQGGTFEEKNVFSWVESYQTFATQTYAQGLLVSASCIPENIQAGETCILDTNGDMDSATGTPVVSPSTFFVQNDFGSIHIGVNQLVAGTWAPVFVSPEIVKGPVDLTPLVSVMVWFDLTLTSGTMFFESISNSVEVDYNGSTTQTATYTVDETWTLGAAALARNSYSITDGFSYIDSRLDPFVFASSLRGIQIAPIAGLVAAQATTTSGFAAPPPEIEGILQFSTAAEANNAWAFLKQKIMHNIQQNVPAKVDDNTIKVTLKFLAITFMKFMIKGATNPDKIKNAFLAELQALATQPTSTQIRMGGLAVMNTTRTCQFVALDTTVALNRDVQHHNVYGYVLTKVSRSISIAWFMS